MDHLVERRVEDFLHDLSSPTPTPGGGSASAAAGAMGAALLAMVAALPKTRAGDPAARAALDEALKVLAPLRDRLAELIDRDTASYNAVTAAYKLPKGSQEEQARRSESIQHALRGATDVPLQVMRGCHRAAVQGLAVARHGNRSARSDAGIGFELLRAALRGAAMNVRINLDGLKDPEYVRAAQAEIRQLDEALERVAREALASLAES